MEYITTKEASAKWGISPTRITILANEGRIPGAHRLGKTWLIPASATKPEPRKARQARNKSDNFSFPLYHFRPDFSYIKEADLSPQQQTLLLAETAVIECRFSDAYLLLETIMNATEDIVTEIGILCNAAICCIALNKPTEFSRVYLRLETLLADDFPHREDLLITLDLIKTYVNTIESMAKNYTYNLDVSEQALPLTCVLIGYNRLIREILKLSKADISSLEANLRLLKSNGAVLAAEYMHFYLMGINYIRQNEKEAQKHATAAVQIAYENKFFLPLVTFSSYNQQTFEPILAAYPDEFQNLCRERISQFAKNCNAFYASISENDLFSKFTAKDYSYSNAVLIGLNNTQIAEKLGVSKYTVKRRISIIFKKLGVRNRQELIEYLRSCL